MCGEKGSSVTLKPVTLGSTPPPPTESTDGSEGPLQPELVVDDGASAEAVTSPTKLLRIA